MTRERTEPGGAGETWEGGCLCGAVRFRVRRLDSRVLACHCRQCRQMSGHVFAATAANWNDLEIMATGELRWFASGPNSRRGFCGTCGSSLFFDHGPLEPIGIAAGAFDRDPPFRLAAHIWVEEAGGYYQLSDGLPQFTAKQWHDQQGWQQYRGRPPKGPRES